MKVIDLLNKIANVEEVPQIIKYDNKTYFYDREVQDYSDFDKNYALFSDFLNNSYGLNNCLNDEVEILEEPKGIPEKLDHLIGYDIRQFDDLKEYVEITTNDLFGKVNKIIDILNQVLDYLKSKGE